MSVLAAVFSSGAHAADPSNWDECTKAKDQDRVIAGCTAVLQDPAELKTKGAQAYSRRATAYFLKHDYDRTFADAESALRLDPKEGGAYSYRGLVFQIRGNDDAAIADFTRAIDLGWVDAPGFPSVRIHRANVYAYKGAIAQAMKDYDAVLQTEPNDLYARLLRGIAYIYGGAPDKAILDLKHIADLHPKDPMIAIWLHIAERRAGKDGQLASTHRSARMPRATRTRI